MARDRCTERVEHALNGLRDNTVTHVDLCHCHLGCTGATQLGLALAESTSVKHLDLQLNQIGDEGGRALGVGLANNISLGHLILAYNEIGDEGGCAIAASIEQGTSLRHLNLLANGMGPRSGEALGAALKKNSSLVHLNVSDNFIGTAGGSAIGGALQTNSTLKHLNISRNTIGHAGGRALAAALEKNSTLVYLNCDGCDIDHGVIMSAMEANVSLQHLDLSENRKHLSHETIMVNNSSLRQLNFQDRQSNSFVSVEGVETLEYLHVNDCWDKIDGRMIAGQHLAEQLINAAATGSTEEVKRLIEFNASPNTRVFNQYSALQCAARGGYVDIIKILLETGAIVLDSHREEPLKLATMYKRPDAMDFILATIQARRAVFKTLAARSKENRVSAQLDSALCEAISTNHFVAIQSLILAGGNVVHVLSWRSGKLSSSTLELLVAHGADPALYCPNMIEALLERNVLEPKIRSRVKRAQRAIHRGQERLRLNNFDFSDIVPEKSASKVVRSGWDRTGLCLKCGHRYVHLMRCSRCKRATYCSHRCQQPDWARHFAVCHSPASRKTSGSYGLLRKPCDSVSTIQSKALSHIHLDRELNPIVPLASDTDYGRYIKLQHAMSFALNGIRPFITAMASKMHARITSEVHDALGHAKQCKCGNRNFADVNKDGHVFKRRPTFRRLAAYATPAVHAPKCSAKGCRGSLDPCPHRLADSAVKSIDPQYGKGSCFCEAWASAVTKYHAARKLTYINSDPMKWASCPWEIAKLLMAQLAPFDADNDCPSKFALRKTSAHDHDGTGLFNLAIYCSMFHGKTVQIDPVTYVPSIDVDLWRSALQARNQYTAHLPNLSVPEDEFLRGIIAFDRLLGDAALCVGPWAAHALEARQCIRYVTTLSELELSRSLIKDISNHRSLTAFRVQRQVKTLTAQQCESFLRFRDALLRKQQRPGRPFLPPRLLVQAPSGSGKTVIAEKLAATFLLEHRESTKLKEDDPFLTFGVEDDVLSSCLLLCHSATMVQTVLVPHVRTELEAAIGGDFVNITTACDGIEHTLSVPDAPNCSLVITTVDSLHYNRKRHADRFDLVVVDEGHVVLSFQDQRELAGQHVFTESKDVVLLIEGTMRGDGGDGAGIIVFHDQKHQHVGATPAFEAFSFKLHSVSVPLKIVRNPGAVRDASIPSYQDTTGDTNGRVRVIGVLGEEDKTARESLVPGRVDLVDVYMQHIDGLTSPFDAMRGGKSCGQTEITIAQAYGLSIATALATFDNDALENSVAVLTPSSSSSRRIWSTSFRLFAMRAIDEMLHLDTEHQLKLFCAFVSSVRFPTPGRLFFGPTANFVGHEAAVVITAGFDLERKRGVVNPELYVAITRSTSRLIMVERDVQKTCAHPRVYAGWSSHRGVVDMLGELRGCHKGHIELDDQTRRANEIILHLDYKVDLSLDWSHPDIASRLRGPVSLSFPSITLEAWEKSTFSWALCESEILKVSVTVDDILCNARVRLLQRMNVFSLKSLESLTLAGMSLDSLPPEIGNLVMLRHLDLHANKFVTLPSHLGSLKRLQTLNVDRNLFLRVPHVVLRLPSLKSFSMDDNGYGGFYYSNLTEYHCQVEDATGKDDDGIFDYDEYGQRLMPRDDGSYPRRYFVSRLISRLEKLESLHIHGEMGMISMDSQSISREPKQWENCESNILPPEVGKLGALKSLVVSSMSMTRLPSNVCALQTLTHLDVSKNALTTLPAEIGDLQGLETLILAFNFLRHLPKDLATLPRLRTLRLGQNYLGLMSDWPSPWLVSLDVEPVTVRGLKSQHDYWPPNLDSRPYLYLPHEDSAIDFPSGFGSKPGPYGFLNEYGYPKCKQESN